SAAPARHDPTVFLRLLSAATRKRSSERAVDCSFRHHRPAMESGRTWFTRLRRNQGRNPMKGCLILSLSAAFCLVFAAAVPAGRAQEGVQVRFDLSDPRGGPFPADRFTVPDPTQLTGLRVELPTTGLDCSADPRPSDCNDIQVLNTLDGFNLQPRLSIPFTGPIDPASVSSDTVFLFRLGCLITTCPCDRSVGINQVVWDPATNTLYAESDQLLDQDARYLLVVTSGIRDASGNPIGSTQFRRLLNFGQTKDVADKAYRAALLG